MNLPKYQVFICTKQRSAGNSKGCCYECGALDVYEAFNAEIGKRQLEKTVEVYTSGCLDHCSEGPVAVVYQPNGSKLSSPPKKLQRLFYPKGHQYGHITLTDVAEIVESHFTQDQPLRRCQL